MFNLKKKFKKKQFLKINAPPPFLRFAVEDVHGNRFLIWKVRCAQDSLLYHFTKFQEHPRIFKDGEGEWKILGAIVMLHDRYKYNARTIQCIVIVL